LVVLKMRKPTMSVIAFSPAVSTEIACESTLRKPPVGPKRNETGSCGIIATISRYQSGTKTTRRKSAVRLRRYSAVM
jgi:hypothetical protein